MAVKHHHHQSIILPSRNLNQCWFQSSIGTLGSSKRAVYLDYAFSNVVYTRKRCLMRLAWTETCNRRRTFESLGSTKLKLCYPKTRRVGQLLPFASSEDGVTVDGSSLARVITNLEEMRVKLNESLQGDDYGGKLVQSSHDAARVFELAIKEQGFLTKLSWLSTAWLGVDRNAWAKTLSYQASVYSLLHAACEVSSRGDGRDRDINIFVQRSLLRLSAPLESLIREKLSAKQPEAHEWFWSDQIPAVVTSFVNYFEEYPCVTSATAMSGRGSDNGSDASLLLLALTCIATITKLGPAKVSCPQFFSMITDITGRLMDMLVDLVSIRQAYQSISDIGLHREFLVHFGPRAATCRVKNDRGSEEVVFWVNLAQEQLQQAIDREKMWSRLTTSESIERLEVLKYGAPVPWQVLEKDLAIFGFFIALGRSTRSFLSANGFDVIDDPIEGFISYLIGGSVLCYPQLSSISSYQLYVEVVCEELDWLPFYLGSCGSPKQSLGHKNKQHILPNAEAIPQILDVCSHWMQSFIKYSKWLESPSNVKAVQFLSRGHNKLVECKDELGISRNLTETHMNGFTESTRSDNCLPIDRDTDSFDKALESVEEALVRLEKLLQELHVSSSTSGKEHLQAACSDLERIRKLKKEAEFLEASFRAKAASLQQGNDESDLQSSVSKQQSYLQGKRRKNANARQNRRDGKFQGLWRFFVPSPTKKSDPDLSVADGSVNNYIGDGTLRLGASVLESNEIHRFEVLRNELMELEKRVQRSTDQPENAEDIEVTDEYSNDASNVQLVQVQKKQNVIEKSLDKLKETSTDVLQGTQLLAIDVATATGFLKRALIGDELTAKEKKVLRRTLTDLASVIPIGVLMLLPVTAVGHAAILAAIQRYVPALIPSTYGPERLDLLRQLEKVKEMESGDIDAKGNGDDLA